MKRNGRTFATEPSLYFRYFQINSVASRTGGEEGDAKKGARIVQKTRKLARPEILQGIKKERGYGKGGWNFGLWKVCG